MRFAKIVATLGPACEDIEIMRQMVQQGVDVFRLNLSHGSHAVHAKSIALIKKIHPKLYTNYLSIEWDKWSILTKNEREIIYKGNNIILGQ